MTSQAAAFHAVLFWALPPAPPDIPYITSTVKGTVTPTSSMATAPTTTIPNQAANINTSDHVSASQIMVFLLKCYLLSFIPFLCFSACCFLGDWLGGYFHRRASSPQVPAQSSSSTPCFLDDWLGGYHHLRAPPPQLLAPSSSSTLLAPFRYIGRLPKVNMIFFLCVIAWFVHCIRRELLYPHPYCVNDYILCGARFAVVVPLVLLFHNRDTLIADARNLIRLFGQSYARVRAFFVGCKNAVFRAGSAALAWCARCLATLIDLARSAGSGLADAFTVTLRAIARTVRFVCWALSWLWSLIWEFLGWTVRTAIIYWPSIRHIMAETYSLSSYYLRQWSTWRWNLFLARFNDVIEILSDGLKKKVYTWPHERLTSEIAVNQYLEQRYRDMVKKKDEEIAGLVEWKGDAQVREVKNNEEREDLQIFRFRYLGWQEAIQGSLRATYYGVEAVGDPVDHEGKDRLIAGLRADKRSLNGRIDNLIGDLKEKDEQCAEKLKLKDDEIKLRDDKIKVQDDEIKLKDAKINEQVAIIQGHEQRVRDLTSTNMKHGKDLVASQGTSAIWQAKAEELTQQLAQRPDSSDADRRAKAAVEDAAEKIVEADSKTDAAEKKAKEAAEELESQMKVNAELSAEHSKIMKENEEYHDAKVDLERELARLRELIPVDVNAMETEPTVNPDDMDVRVDDTNICLETYGFPIGEFCQEENALPAWMIAHPSNVTGCGADQGASAENGLNSVSGASGNAGSDTPVAHPNSAGDMEQNSTPDNKSVNDEALAQAKYTQLFPDGHKPLKESHSDHYLGSFAAVEDSMKAQQCPMVASPKALRILFETHRDKINAGLELMVDNGPLMPQQLARVIQIWGQQHGLHVQLGVVADVLGSEKPIVQLVGPENQTPGSQTVFIYKNVTDGKEGAFWTTPWRALARRLVIRGSKKPGTKPSPLSAGSQGGQASQQPPKGKPSQGSQTIPDFDGKNFGEPAATEKLSDDELRAIGEEKYHEAFPYGHIADIRFCEDRHQSGFLALSESILKQRLGLKATSNILIKSYDQHHARKELPQRDKGAVLTQEQLSKLLILWGDDQSKFLVLGVVLEIHEQKTQYLLAENFDRTQKDQKIVWVGKNAMGNNIKIDEVPWKGLARK